MRCCSDADVGSTAHGDNDVVSPLRRIWLGFELLWSFALKSAELLNARSVCLLISFISSPLSPPPFFIPSSSFSPVHHVTLYDADSIDCRMQASTTTPAPYQFLVRIFSQTNKLQANAIVHGIAKTSRLLHS